MWKEWQVTRLCFELDTEEYAKERDAKIKAAAEGEGNAHASQQILPFWAGAVFRSCSTVRPDCYWHTACAELLSGSCGAVSKHRPMDYLQALKSSPA